jgi:hypothetical protein
VDDRQNHDAVVGGAKQERARPKVHLRAVQPVLEDAISDLLPRETAFAALVEIS